LPGLACAAAATPAIASAASAFVQVEILPYMTSAPLEIKSSLAPGGPGARDAFADRDA